MRTASILAVAAPLLASCIPQIDPADRAQRLIIAKAFTPASLDPGDSATGDAAPILDQVYEQLTTLDTASPTADPLGELAESWSTSADGRSIDMVLKAGRRFADGAPVDAAAVKYSFDRVKRIGRASSFYLEWLDRVEVTDPLRFRLHLKRPYSPALQLLAQPATSIISPRSIRAHDPSGDGSAWLADHSAGSGPYVLARNIVGQSVVLTRNPRSQATPTHFAEIEFRALPDEGVRRLLLERGDVDITDIVPAAFVDRYRSLPGVTVLTRPGGVSLSFLTLNTRTGVFADRRMREAVSAAIDYRGLRELVLKGNAIQLAGYLVPGTAGFDSSEPPPRRDLTRARALLAAAGYRGEAAVMLVSLIGPVAEFIQANLREAGINVRIERRFPGALQAQAKAGQFALIYDGWTLDTPDALPMFEALFASRSIAGGTNGSGLSNPRIDELVDRAMATNDAAARRLMMLELDRLLRLERPVVMLFSANSVNAFRSDLAGVEINRYRPFLMPIATMRRAPVTAGP